MMKITAALIELANIYIQDAENNKKIYAESCGKDICFSGLDILMPAL